MRSTIDRAGRVVIPKALRDQLGIEAGEVELTTDGAAIRIEPVTDTHLEQRGERLVIPATGTVVDDELVHTLRDADQR